MSIATAVATFPGVAGARTAVAVTLYGSWWNVPSHRIRSFLERSDIGYRWVNLTPKSLAAEAIARQLGAALRPPVLCIEGDWMLAPTLDEVAEALRRHGLLERE